MTRARLAGLLGAALTVALCLTGPAHSQPPGSVPPVYAQRLHIPVRGDDFAQPRAVVADLHTGEVFVCDSQRNRIVIFDEQGRFRYQIPGGSTFQSPIDLAVDPDGFLFVVSQVSSEVARLDFDGRLIDHVALAGLPEGVARPRFGSLAISPGGDRLYLMDVENNRLWIADREGTVRRSIDMTAGRPPKEIDELRYGHVDVYADTLLVPIPTDGLVHLFDLDGRARGTIGSPGAAECQTMFPTAAALDHKGRVIILDQQRAIFMTWDVERGACLTEHYGFGNAPGALYQPSDLALDRQGRVYVSQGFEGRIQVYEGAKPAAVATAVPAPAPPEETTPAAVAAGGATEREASPEPPEIEVSVLVEAPGPAPARPVTEPSAAEVPAVARGEAQPTEVAALLVEGARLSVERGPEYDQSYFEIEYPGGDLPADRGAAVDVVIRAFRHAGVDLQEAVHRDIVEDPGAYGIGEPDPSVDHRRIRNLVTFFERRAASLATGPDADWAPGDLVFWDRDSNGAAGHLGVLTSEAGVSGKLLVVHHHRPTAEFTGRPSADDVLFRWPVVGHYRWSPPTEADGEASSPAESTDRSS